MADPISRLDPTFITQQKRQLKALKREILALHAGQQQEQIDSNTAASGQAREYEEDAQRLSALELAGNLQAVDAERLSNIERALQKIDDGTYGLSDSSGAPIALERLQVFPEAIYTIDEQQSRDAARRGSNS